MRKIFASLFAIVAVVGVGVFATGAYFTDTASISNQVFTTGTADLKFGQCGVIGDDCTLTPAILDSYAYPPGNFQLTGPDHANSGCLVIENTGDYALNLTASVTVTAFSHVDMGTYFELAADVANNLCNPTGTLMGWQPAWTAQGASPFAFGGTLNPGARMYVVLYNRWDSTGNQNYLQGGYITLTTQVDGTTN